MNIQAIGATENTLQTAVADLDSLQALRRIVMLLESQSCVDISGRQRVTVDAITGGQTIGSVQTVSNLSTIANVDHHQFIDTAQNMWANAIRSKLSFS
jgi:hypothetical protein